jgi:hypothetical protein
VISVSVAFSSLSLDVISQVKTYSIESLFGDFSGVTGALLGLDAVSF